MPYECFVAHLCVVSHIWNSYSAQYKVQVNVKLALEQATKLQRGEYRYNSTLYLTSALEGVSGQCQPRGRFTPGKGTVPIVKEAGLVPRPFWTDVENLAPLEFDPRTVQPLPTTLSRSKILFS